MAAAARPGDLAADGTSLPGFFVKVVDAGRSDSRRGFFLVHPALVEQFTETIEVPSQQHSFHLDSNFFGPVHRRKRLSILGFRTLHLVFNNWLGLAASDVAEEQVVFEFVDEEVTQSQWRDHYLFTMEFYEIEAAKGSGVLVLSATLDSYVIAFDVISQFSHPRGCNGQSEQLAKQAD